MHLARWLLCNISDIDKNPPPPFWGLRYTCVLCLIAKLLLSNLADEHSLFIIVRFMKIKEKMEIY